MRKASEKQSQFRTDIIILTIRGQKPAEISDIVGCSRPIVSYHRGVGHQKVITRRKDQKRQRVLIDWFRQHVQTGNQLTQITILEILGVYPTNIAKVVNCNRARISQLRNKEQYAAKQKQIHQSKLNDLEYIVRRRITQFCRDRRRKKRKWSEVKSFRQMISKRINGFTRGEKQMFHFDELMEKIGDNPRCAMTGRTINLQNRKSWQLDHIIPSSKGGDDTLENCQLVCTEANQSKANMTEQEHLNLCREILEHHGFVVTRVLEP
jgi:5-methylcytosine-specific restriction endonuclease McrA